MAQYSIFDFPLIFSMRPRETSKQEVLLVTPLNHLPRHPLISMYNGKERMDRQEVIAREKFGEKRGAIRILE